MFDLALSHFEELRISLNAERNKAIVKLGECAYEYFRINAQLGTTKTVNYGDLSNEREAVRRPSEKLAEVDLVLRYLRDWKKKQDDARPLGVTNGG